MKSFNLLVVVSIGLLSFSCGKGESVYDLVGEILSDREGTPALFQLGEKKFSLPKFRDETRFRRIILEKKNPFLSPTEAELYLNGYIEETVLLQQARQEIDFKSKDFKEFITPYLAKGVIDYYFFEKTGGLKDYRNFNYDSEIVNEMKAKGILKENVSKEEEKMLAELVVWRRLELNSKKRQDDIKLMIAKLKIQNKVTVFPVSK